ncbi:hypothetical protein H4Q26_011131 [Puccinia striiformis f. sp. tritici PST-130]|nr:hypothetical protein H4Q26_011131 [Puccinia striiformis f. sp. tritici PST-130]
MGRAPLKIKPVKGQPDSSRRKDWKLVRRQTRPVVYPEVKDTCLKILANSLHSIKINCHYTSHYLLFTVQYTPIDYRSLPSAALKYGRLRISHWLQYAIHHPEATDLELQASSHSSNLTELLDATPGLYLAILVPSFSVWHCMGWLMALDVIPIVFISSEVHVHVFTELSSVLYRCLPSRSTSLSGLFTPALVFGKVAFFLTPEKLAGLWSVSQLQ